MRMLYTAFKVEAYGRLRVKKTPFSARKRTSVTSTVCVRGAECQPSVNLIDIAQKRTPKINDKTQVTVVLPVVFNHFCLRIIMNNLS